MELGIYVHIPFCVKKCTYCNFYSEVKPNLINDYVLSLVKEIKRESEKYKNFQITTILNIIKRGESFYHVSMVQNPARFPNGMHCPHGITDIHSTHFHLR